MKWFLAAAKQGHAEAQEMVQSLSQAGVPLVDHQVVQPQQTLQPYSTLQPYPTLSPELAEAQEEYNRRTAAIAAAKKSPRAQQETSGSIDQAKARWHKPVWMGGAGLRWSPTQSDYYCYFKSQEPLLPDEFLIRKMRPPYVTEDSISAFGRFCGRIWDRVVGTL